MRASIVLFSLFLLAGCASQNLFQLRLLDPQANSFGDALAAEYLAYANAEAEQGRHLSAEYFAHKGMRAWRGEAVPPEPVEDFLSKAAQKRLKSSRDMLLALLTDDVKHVVPQQAARAQLLFDCWAKQEGQRKKEAPACAEELPAALIEMQTVAASFGLGGEETHDITFAAGSAKLSRSAQQKVRAISEPLRNQAAYIIETEGCADTPAAKRLLEKRTEALGAGFAARGIPAERIRIKESGGQKAVYLSRDDGIKDKNLVRVTVHVFSQHGKPANGH